MDGIKEGRSTAVLYLVAAVVSIICADECRYIERRQIAFRIVFLRSLPGMRIHYSVTLLVVSLKTEDAQNYM